MTTKQMIGLGLRLAIFVAVVVAMLSLVNFLTRGTIAERNRQAGETAREALMKDCSFSQEKDLKVPEDSGITAVYRAEKDGILMGYCFDITVKGYNEISMIVGVDLNLTVTGVKVLSQTETPGIGSKAVDEDGIFLPQFENQPKPETVDTVSNATISSKGIRQGVVDCVSFCEEILEAKEADADGKE